MLKSPKGKCYLPRELDCMILKERNETIQTTHLCLKVERTGPGGPTDTRWVRGSPDGCPTAGILLVLIIPKCPTPGTRGCQGREDSAMLRIWLRAPLSHIWSPWMNLSRDSSMQLWSASPPHNTLAIPNESLKKSHPIKHKLQSWF